MAGKKVIESIEGAPDTEVGYTAADGSQKTIKSGADGIFEATTPEEVAVLQSFDFKAMKASVAATEKAAKVKEPDAPTESTPDAKE